MARSFFLASSLAFVLASAAFLTYVFISFRRVTVETLSSYADKIAIFSVSVLFFDDKAAATETLTSLRVRPDIMQAVIYDDKGRPFASYRLSPASSAILSAENIPNKRVYWIANGHLIVAHDIHFREQYLGIVYVEAGLVEITHRALRYIGIGLGVFLASVLLSWLVSGRLQRRITGPIFALTSVAERVLCVAVFSVRVVFLSVVVVGVLADAFNNMLGQIQLQNEALFRVCGVLVCWVVVCLCVLVVVVVVRRCLVL